MPYFDLPPRAYARKLYMREALAHFGGLELPRPPRPPDWTGAQEQKLLARMRELVRSQPQCGLAPAACSRAPEGLWGAERLARLGPGLPPATSDPAPEQTSEGLPTGVGPAHARAAPSDGDAEAKAVLQCHGRPRTSGTERYASGDREVAGHGAAASAGHAEMPDTAEDSAARARAGAVPVRAAARAGKRAGSRGGRQSAGRFAMVAAAAVESVRRRQRGERADAGGGGVAEAALYDVAGDTVLIRRPGEEAGAGGGSIAEAKGGLSCS